MKKENKINDLLVEKANKRKEIHIVPLKTYKLMETMDLPQFNTVKCNGYLEFMSDEFERIKPKNTATLYLRLPCLNF
jgi:hypothetical protein